MVQKEIKQKHGCNVHDNSAREEEFCESTHN